MRFLPWLLLIGISFFGYTQQRNARTAAEQLEGSQLELKTTQSKLESVMIENVQNKHQIDQANKDIAALDGAKKEISDLQAKIRDNETQAEVAKAELEQTKKQAEDASGKMSDVDALKLKLTEAENQLATLKGERDAAKAQIATYQAEVQKLQARPPLGSGTIGTRR